MSQSGSTPNPIVVNIPGGYCYNPSNLRTTVEGNLITFQWDSPHDNDGFYLNYWAGANPPTQVTVFGSGIQLQLSPNTLYNWSVRTMCDRLIDRGSDTVVGVPVLTGNESIACPTIDSSAALLIKSGKTARIEWTPLMGITQYIFQFKHGSAMPVELLLSNNYVNLSILLPATDYSWRVKPKCIDKVSNFSEWASFKSGAGDSCPAVEIKGVVEITTAVLYWTNCVNAKSYQVFLNGTLIADKHPVNIMTLANLLPNTTYPVIVIPNCEEGEGEMALSSITTRNYPVLNPTDFTANFTGGHLVLNWTPADIITAQGLTITGSYFELGPLINTYTLNNPQPGSNVIILLKSINGALQSNGAYLKVAIPGYCRPAANLMVKQTTDTTVRIIWPFASGNTAYQISHRRSDVVSWTSDGTINYTDFTFRNLTPETDYIFRVIAVCGNTTAPPATIAGSTTAIPQCPIPIDLAVSNIAASSALVAFGLSNGKTPYEGRFVAFAHDGVNPIISVEGTLSPILISGLLPDTDYQISVQNRCGVNNDDLPPTSFSDSVGITTLKTCPAVTVTAAYQTNNTEILLNWLAVVGVVNYNVKYRRIGAPDWIDTGNTGLLTKTITGLTPALYEFKVQANMGDYRECFTQNIVNLPQVLNLNKSRFENIHTFYWDPIEGVDSYIVTIVSLAHTTVVKTISPYVKVRLEGSTNYTVSVEAFYNDATGVASDELIFNTGPNVLEGNGDQCEPPIVESFNQDSNINDPDASVGTHVDVSVKIKDYDKSLAYEIQVVVFGEIIPVLVDNIATNDPAFSGSKVYFKVPVNDYMVIVTTFDGNGNKICNTIVKSKDAADCTVPVGLASSDITDTGFQVDWTAVADAIGYDVYLDGVYQETLTDPYYVFSGLDDDTDYDVTVASKCGDLLSSAQSAPLTVHTIPTP